MNNQTAHSIITDTYDYETCREIVDHGCQSGVCSQHIYYGDTIKFFEDHEAEVLSYVRDVLGVETLVDIFKRHDACYDAYRNDVVWTFIEGVAMDVVTDMEKLEWEQEQLIEEYMKPIQPKDSVNFYTSKDGELMDRTGFNPPASMNLNRYSHA